ncbi:hypothetical protein E2C01_001275 [Portunus trituberculatus]|uniref:Uncharacterized protein n=1 Tax=Portunus trituberculatus TaxID=210409 RepID=A0A5B7CGA8_PORTR|nr:hypothetical protein [Portunus trituberculatus]
MEEWKKRRRKERQEDDTGGHLSHAFLPGQSTNLCFHSPVFLDPNSEAKPESTTKINKQPITVLNKSLVVYTPRSDCPALTITETKTPPHTPRPSPC